VMLNRRANKGAEIARFAPYSITASKTGEG
jgi:hypothetical protein